MKFGQAIDDAGELLTLLGLLGVIPVVFVMTQNISNPEFGMVKAFNKAIYGIIIAIKPSIVITIIVAFFLWILANSETNRR